MNILKYFMPSKGAEKPDYFMLWLKALGFAKDAHGDQVIPGTDMPYIAHPVAVFDVLKPCITTSNMGVLVPVAMLHDTIEDTRVTHDDLVREFGRAVADGVLALTKNMCLPKEERMADSIRRIQAQPRPIWMVKLADRIVNLQPPPYFWKPRKIEAYREEARLILGELGSADEYLAKVLKEKISEYPGKMPQKPALKEGKL